MQGTILNSEADSYSLPLKSKNAKYFYSPQKRDYLIAGLLGLACFALSAVYYYFDHHRLMMDESWHILKGYEYRDLWSHFRPWNLSWWQRFLTVDGFYPYVVQSQSGLLKAVIGGGRTADVLLSCTYNFLMGASLFLAVRILGFGIIAAATAVAFINIFPETNQLNHMFMLDFPAMSCTAVGMYLFFRWWNNPGYKSAVTTGLLLGFCCLTKHVAAVFLLGTGLYFALTASLNMGKEKPPKMFFQTATLGLSAASVVFSWILTNHKKINHINNYAKEGLESAGILPDFGSNCFYYLQSYWVTLSPLFCILFVLAVFALKPQDHRKLLPLWSSFVLGFVLMSLYVYPMHRYLLPSLILPAVLCGVLMERIFNYKSLLAKVCVVAVITLAGLQFISFQFMPYPVSSFPVLTQLSKVLQVCYESTKCGGDGSKGNPVPYVDWGYDWVSKRIEKTDTNPVYLNVMVNLSQLNPQTFDLQMRERKSNVFATSSRVWNIAGDIVDFKKDQAVNFQWYLFKEGETGLPFRDIESENNYKALKKFVESSGKYPLVESRKAPDGMDLKLYRVR